MGTEELFKGFCGFPSVVVGNLGRDMVGDVGFADTVEDPSTNGAEHVSVNGGKGTSSKGPLFGGVVGEEGVGVLQIGDEDQPAVC